MALTMTRTSTQAALTKLVETLANINGELEFVEGMLATEESDSMLSQYREALKRRRLALADSKKALCAAIRQFNMALDPDEVGTSAEWKRRDGRSPGRPGFVTRYFSDLTKATSLPSELP